MLLTSAVTTRATTAALRTSSVQIFVIGVPSLLQQVRELTLRQEQVKRTFGSVNPATSKLNGCLFCLQQRRSICSIQLADTAAVLHFLARRPS
jgi:hypothetical protein